jgi:hypothetical protein
MTIPVVKKIAIIAVHGIADQKPYSSAREVADLLNTTHSGSAVPCASEEHILRIPVQPAMAATVPSLRNRTWQSLMQAVGMVRELVNTQSAHHLYTGEPIDEADLLERLETEFLNYQLEQYAPRPWAKQGVEHYQTLRVDQQIDGRSVGVTAAVPITTHTYEMHWADLSQLGSGVLLLLNELYQFLFHLASLGQHVVTLGFLEASERYPRSTQAWKQWQTYQQLQEIATAFISLWIPLFNFHLLLLLLVTLVGKLSLAYNAGILVLAIGALGTLLGIEVQSIRQLKFERWYWIWAGFAVLIFLVLTPVLQSIAERDPNPHFLARWLQALPIADPLGHTYLIVGLLIYWLLGAVVHVGMVMGYEKRRPGAALVHYLVLGVTTVAWIIQGGRLWFNPAKLLPKLSTLPDGLIGHYVVSYASFRTMEVLYLLGVLWWMVFLVSYVGCVLWGVKVRRTAHLAQRRQDLQVSRTWVARIDRANWTARLALSVPCALYFTIVMGFWSAINQLEQWFKWLPPLPEWYPMSAGLLALLRLDRGNFLLWRPIADPVVLGDGGLIGSDDFVQVLLHNVTSPLFGLNLCLIVATVSICLWSFLPSVLREIQPPAQDQEMAALGDWLDRGFRRIRQLAVPLLVVNMVVLFPLGYLLGNLWTPDLRQNWGVLELLNRSSGVALWLLGLLQPLLLLLALISQGFQSKLQGILDAILDVDNYLRVHPREDNPRSRIFARYVSLLRYLATQDYDGIVIVAHSQGAVITADVLRFLQRDPACFQLPPLRLFTMGAPIHQLYSFSFPHLYGWAAHYDEPSADRTCDYPQPQALGVQQWVNAYGSGDYVGRYLWGRDRQMYQADQRYRTGHENCFEFCLSEGAHTHYWDGTSPQVGTTIHQMVLACAAIDRATPLQSPQICQNGDK